MQLTIHNNLKNLIRSWGISPINPSEPHAPTQFSNAPDVDGGFNGITTTGYDYDANGNFYRPATNTQQLVQFSQGIIAPATLTQARVYNEELAYNEREDCKGVSGMRTCLAPGEFVAPVKGYYTNPYVGCANRDAMVIRPFFSTSDKILTPDDNIDNGILVGSNVQISNGQDGRISVSISLYHNTPITIYKIVFLGIPNGRSFQTDTTAGMFNRPLHIQPLILASAMLPDPITPSRGEVLTFIFDCNYNYVA